jgi:hypothetical protein
MIPIDRALMDSNLLGAALEDSASWSTWLAVLRAAFALPMCNEDRATFAEVAGALIEVGPFSETFGGLAKVDSGFDYAANLSLFACVA